MTILLILQHYKVIPVYDLAVNHITQNLFYLARLEPLYSFYIERRVVYDPPRELHAFRINAVYDVAGVERPIDLHDSGGKQGFSFVDKSEPRPVVNEYTADRAARIGYPVFLAREPVLFRQYQGAYVNAA